MSRIPLVVVHGGAGFWPRNLHGQALRGVRKASTVGLQVLAEHDSAVDAVEAAVIELEDNPLFNAGTGSALNLLGEVENDAAIMDGKSLRGAGVALLKGIKNPVMVARTIMERTDHVLLAGVTARKLALANRIPTGDLKTRDRVKAWRQALKNLQRGQSEYSKYHRQTVVGLFDHLSDTVGALAINSKGNAAAADSTGGMQLKLPGRIGDSAILGAGIYADSFGAAAATGSGEQAMRLAITKTACILMENKAAFTAAIQSVRLATRLFGPGTGLITLKPDGSYGVAHNTPNLCWAMKSAEKERSSMIGVRVSGK